MLQHNPFSQEFRPHILVVGLLAEPQLLLGEDVGLRAGRHAGYALGRDLDEPGAGLLAESHEVLHAAVIDFLDIVSF